MTDRSLDGGAQREKHRVGEKGLDTVKTNGCEEGDCPY